MEISPGISKIPTKLKNTSSDNTKEPEIQSIAEVSQETEFELLKTIQKLKGELAEKDKQLAKYKERLKNLGSDLNKSRQKIKYLSIKNSSLLQNYSTLKNVAKNQANNKQKIEKGIIPKNNNFLLNTLS